MYVITATILALITALAGSSPQIDGAVVSEAKVLFEQQLTSFDDVCEEQNDGWVRHVRFATLSTDGQVEDQLELRTTTGRHGNAGPVRVFDHLVNGAVIFTRVSGGEPQPTAAGRQLLSAKDGNRAAKILAAFAAAQPRVFAADIEAPAQSCGALEGKSEEKVKCGAIGVLGCGSGNPLVCGVSAGLAILCSYLVDKTCEAEPDTCQPGWTEG